MPVAVVTALAMFAFAANSLLCRFALRDGAIDPATFTVIRLAAGAVALWAIVRWRAPSAAGRGNWGSALALLAYAAAFSWAYLSLTAATGALLLFGAVQATMIGAGLVRGERPRGAQAFGIGVALAGLVWLLLPGLAAPDPFGAAAMLAAGIAWGVYSLRGRAAGAPLRVNAGNFARAALASLPLLAFATVTAPSSARGVALAIASGALASGVGYAIWYTAVPRLRATTAATVQLSVPLLTAVAGVALLDEEATWRLAIAGVAILGGIALVVRGGAVRPAEIAPGSSGTTDASGPAPR